MRCTATPRTATSSCATSSRTRTTPRDFDFEDRLRRHRTEVESRLSSLGARNLDVEEETEYAFRVSFEYDGDLKLLADFVEDIPEAEVLSLGRALEIVKDLGDAESVTTSTGSRLLGHARDRPRAHGDRVRGRHRRSASLLGVPVLGRRGRPQRAADELLHVAPAPRARGPPLHVRVRLGDHRRLPRRGDDEGRVARGGDAASRSTSSTASSPTSP